MSGVCVGWEGEWCEWALYDAKLDKKGVLGGVDGFHWVRRFENLLDKAEVEGLSTEYSGPLTHLFVVAVFSPFVCFLQRNINFLGEIIYFVFFVVSICSSQKREYKAICFVCFFSHCFRQEISRCNGNSFSTRALLMSHYLLLFCGIFPQNSHFGRTITSVTTCYL